VVEDVVVKKFTFALSSPDEFLVTSPAGAVAKYCDEHVCVCVCVCVCLYVRLSARVSPKSQARSLPIFLCMLPMAGARSTSGTVTKSQWEGAVLGVFFPSDNALYSIVFGTHTKTAEPIEMPFGMMTRVGRRYHVLC